MDTNSVKFKNIKTDLICPELSYVITGIIFSAHNELGQYAKEKQYGDLIEEKFKEKKISYVREKQIGNSGNNVDFLAEGKIILELKAKRLITKEDYFQTKRYFQETGVELAILVNFRRRFRNQSVFFG